MHQNNFEVLSQEEIDVIVPIIDEIKDNLIERGKVPPFIKAKGVYDMSEVLTSEEIDQLLTAINAGETEPEDFRPAMNSRKIKIYDFKRPDKFSKEQIRTMSIMHETFSRLCTTFLSSLTRSMVHVHVASVDQLTYDEFLRSIPTPTTLGIINMDPLRGNALIEIDPAITFTILDRLLGGPGDALQCQHELTDIECGIMEGILVRMLGCMREAWTYVLDLRPRLGQIDTNPQFCQIVHPAEMVVLITMEAKICDTEGMINLCFPYLTIEPIISKLSAEYWYMDKDENAKAINPEIVYNADHDLKAVIIKRHMSLGEIADLKVGDTILRSNDNVYGKLYADDLALYEFNLHDDNEIVLGKKLYIKEKNYMEEKLDTTNMGDLRDVKIMISVELGRASRTLNEISRFDEGTIVELDKISGAPLDVFANNVKIAHGEVVVIDENFGIRLTEVFQS